MVLTDKPILVEVLIQDFEDVRVINPAQNLYLSLHALFGLLVSLRFVWLVQHFKCAES